MQSTPSKMQPELAGKVALASLTPAATESVQAVPAGALSIEAVAATEQAAPIVVCLRKGSTFPGRKRIKQTAQRNGINLRVPKRIQGDANTIITTFEVCGNLPSKDCDNQVKFARTGGWEAGVDAMQKHAGEGRVQELGCLALPNLDMNDDDIAEKIESAGGMEAVVDVKKKQPSDVGVQEQGRKVLNDVVLNNDAIETEIGRTGEITAVLDAMRKHCCNEGVQEQGCGDVTYMACRGKGACSA